MGRIKVALLLLIIVLIYFPRAQSQRRIPTEIQRQIDDYIENTFLPSNNIYGLALAIVQNDGELLYTTGYGWANKEEEIFNGNTTQFNIGSISKSFTALLTTKALHEKFPELGETVLDTPIRELMPEINFTLIDRFRSERATFRDIFSHRLCQTGEDMLQVADAFDSTADIAYGMRYNEPECAMRSEGGYNNQMFMFAGVLAGILANKSYEEAGEELLAELGMVNSAFTKKTDNFTQMPFRAMPYYVMDQEAFRINEDLVKRLENSNPAGGIFATPDDMARYMRLYLNQGILDGEQVIPKEVMEWRTKPSYLGLNAALPGSFKENESDIVINNFGYELGFRFGTYDGWQFIHHAGYWPSYFSQMSLFPGKNLGIFTSANFAPVLEHQVNLHAFIFEILRGLDAEEAQKKVVSFNKKGSFIPENVSRKKEQEARLEEFILKQKSNPFHKQAEIVGQYGSGSAGEVIVSEKLNPITNEMEYYLDYGKWYSGFLEDLWGGVAFQLNLDTDAITDFYADGDKEAINYVGFDNGTLIFFYLPTTFKFGLRMDELPPVPWDPESC